MEEPKGYKKVNSRHRARALALKALYESDTSGHNAEDVLTRLLEKEILSQENIDFARELVNGVLDNLEAIDGHIHTYAPAWPLKQMPLIDKNILRLAIFEILLNNKVPVKVAINEAVELAKKYGSENSSRFVNGVLGSVSANAGR